MSQREVGTHTRTFASALKGSLREDPDVIVVGELRDTETVRMALAASETGHLLHRHDEHAQRGEDASTGSSTSSRRRTRRRCA